MNIRNLWIIPLAIAAAVVGLVSACSSSEQAPGAEVSSDHSSRLAAGLLAEEASAAAIAPSLWSSLADADELLILADSRSSNAASGDDVPRGLRIVRSGSEEPLVLEFTDVQAQVHASIATVDVTQRYRNPFEEVIEAEYVFPLPQDAAVRDFVMVIGRRRIRGILREKAEAERIYARARQAGHTASLLTQARPNIFVQRVANIEPGHRIDVAIRYFHTLPHRDGAYEFTFPSVVGPRFHPPHQGRSRVPEVGSSSGHPDGFAPLSFELSIDGHESIRDVECLTHEVDIDRSRRRGIQVRLRDRDRRPDRDLVVRYRVPEDDLSGSLVSQEGRDGGTFTLLLQPPASTRRADQPLELIFLVDCSGSMAGDPLDQVKEALLLALDALGPDDRFQIIQFSNEASRFTRDPVPGTPEQLRRAARHVRGLAAKGGTMMMEGIEEALTREDDEETTRFVCLMTDGFIGNEPEIFTRVGRNLGRNRIFSFGVGSSPNRFLMENLAILGQGAVEFLNPRDDARPVMRRFLDRARRPAWTRVDVEFPGADVTDVYPERIPDLYSGRPILVTGRYRGDPPREALLTGRTQGRRHRVTIPTLGSVARERASLDAIWAREKIADLSRSAWIEPGRASRIQRDILNVALEHGLVSQFTAFVAVDGREAVNDGAPERTVLISVPFPEGTESDPTTHRHEEDR